MHDDFNWLGMRVLIDEMLIRIIRTLTYQGKDPTDEFVGKNEDKEMMKEKFRLVNKSHKYEIKSIKDHGAHFIAHILVGKIMRKCRANEVLVVVVSLAK